MHAGSSPDYLSDAFLDRVRRAYRLALQACEARKVGHIWGLINERRIDVHGALMNPGNDGLRRIFSDPTSTDLFYGVEDCCRSYEKTDDFVGFAFNSQRNAIARYQVDRLCELLNQIQGSSIVEIGPGMGRVAYHAFCSGMKNYTTVDLPLGIVAQACFLGATLGPDALWFEGDDQAFAKDRIRILPAGRKPQGRFAVALNTDSLTELSPAVAFECALWLAREAAVFLSINHERNLFTAKEVVAAAAGQLLLRRPCPAWPGYIEEVFKMNGPTNFPEFRYFSLRALIDGRRWRRRFAQWPLKRLFRSDLIFGAGGHQQRR